MTLRQKFACDPRFAGGDPIGLAATLLVLYEYGDKGLSTKDPMALRRIADLQAMNDEQFDKEHQRILGEFKGAQNAHD